MTVECGQPLIDNLYSVRVKSGLTPWLICARARLEGIPAVVATLIWWKQRKDDRRDHRMFKTCSLISKAYLLSHSTTCHQLLIIHPWINASMNCPDFWPLLVPRRQCRAGLHLSVQVAEMHCPECWKMPPLSTAASLHHDLCLHRLGKLDSDVQNDFSQILPIVLTWLLTHLNPMPITCTATGKLPVSRIYVSKDDSVALSDVNSYIPSD